MRERAISFGEGGRLVGILSEPAAAAQRSQPAVILLNAGMVHRVGPSRLNVRIARRLCERGWLVLRFDHGGVGDSGIRRDRSPWLEGTIAEATQAMDELARSHGTERFVLMGLCSGAVTAFKTAVADGRVVGAGFLNSQGLDTSEEWNTYVKNRGWIRHYWKNSLRSGESWRRALTGRVQYKRLVRVFSRSVAQRLLPSKRVTAVNGQLSDELRRLAERGVRLLFVLSAGDHAEDYFDVVAGGQMGPLRASGCFAWQTVARSDHTFTLLGNQREVLDLIQGWMGEGRQWAPRPVGRPASAGVAE